VAFALAEIKSGDTRRVLQETNDREFFALDGFDLQPVFIALGAIRGVRTLRDNTFPVQFGGVLEHLLTVSN
jgi:hypothetical protein